MGRGPERFAMDANAASAWWSQVRNRSEEDPERLAAAGTLANSLVGQGQYFEAEEMLFEVLAVKKRALGADPADTLATANYLVRLQKKVIHLFYFFSNQTWLHSRHQRITV